MFNVRWDYNLNSTNTFFFRYSRQNADLSDPRRQPEHYSSQPVRRRQLRRKLGPYFQPSYDTRSRLRLQSSRRWRRPGRETHYPRRVFRSTGIRMYQAEVFGDPLVNITFGAYAIGGAVELRSLATRSTKDAGISR